MPDVAPGEVRTPPEAARCVVCGHPVAGRAVTLLLVAAFLTGARTRERSLKGPFRHEYYNITVALGLVLVVVVWSLT